MGKHITYVKQFDELKKTLVISVWEWGVDCILNTDYEGEDYFDTEIRKFKKCDISPTIESAIKRCLSYYNMEDANIENIIEL